MKRNIAHIVIAVFVAVLIFCPVSAIGQDKKFPERPINVYIGYPPGGSGSNSGTIVCEGMKRYLKQPVILNHRPGAAQTIAVAFALNLKPDGYSLVWINNGDLVPKLVQDAALLKFGFKDIEYLGGGGYSPAVLAVNANSPWKTMRDLMADARKSPNKVNVGSAGAGMLSHLVIELFSMKTGLVFNHVPFAGGGPVITALLGGHVDATVMSMSTLGAHIMPGGKLRPLIIFDQKRSPDLPNVPTALEVGIDIESLTSWYGLGAPKGLSQEVRTILVENIEKVLKDREIVTSLKRVGMDVEYLRPEEVEKKIQKEYKLMEEVCNRAGLINK